MDSGAGKSLTGIKDLFLTLKPGNGSVRFGDGKEFPIKGIGSVQLEMPGCAGNVVVHDVLYVPGADANLLSVHATAAGFDCQLVFDAQKCAVVKDGAVLWDIPASDGGTYTFHQAGKSPNLLSSAALVGRQLESDLGDSTSVTTVPQTPVMLWHRRLGHPNHVVLRTMFKHHVLDNLPDLPQAQFQHLESCLCQSCVLGKGKHLPFPESTTVTTAPLQLVHCDLAGPFSLPGIYGKKYLLVVVDDYTDYCSVLPLRDKSCVGTVLKDLLISWEAEMKVHTVGTLRTDRGSEFVNQALQSWLAAHGVKHETSLPHTHQQNGVVERLIGVLGVKARVLLLESGLSKGFWPHAFLHAAYLKNRTPTSGNPTSTPFYRWFGHNPNASDLRIFGSVCSVLILDHKVKPKLAPTSLMGKFVGMCSGSKGWIIWIPKLHKFVESREVTFFENQVMTAPDLVPYDGSDFFPQTPVCDQQAPAVVDTLSDASSDAAAEDIPLPSALQCDDLGDACNPTTPVAAKDNSVGIQVERMTENPLFEQEVGGGYALLPISPSEASPASPTSHGGSTSQSAVASPASDDIPQSGGVVDQDPVPRRSRRILQQNPEYHGLAALVTTPAMITEVCDISFQEAISGNERDKWGEAIREEYESLVSNGTFTLVKRKPGMKVLDTRWVFAKKLNSTNQVERYKCRLVAKGYMQQHGLDYDDVYAPVTCRSTLRFLLSEAVRSGLHVRQLDVRTAFLNGVLDDVTVYMQQPEGFVSDPSMVCHLTKAIYGLKQAPRAWHKEVKKVLCMHCAHNGICTFICRSWSVCQD